jgi:hypothetical protein
VCRCEAIWQEEWRVLGTVEGNKVTQKGKRILTTENFTGHGVKWTFFKVEGEAIVSWQK